MISVLLPPFEGLPEAPGSYVLILKSSASFDIRVGALGTVSIKKGYYTYIGSARGGLKKRLKRYIKGPTKLHWHIDYLLRDERFSVEEIVCVFSDAEEVLSDLFGKRFESIRGFGSSDTRSPSHLFLVYEV